ECHHGTYCVDVRHSTSGDVMAWRTVPHAIRVALSGGGYRAALFSAGALLFLVDARANHRIEDIASVSGGSIFNAFLRTTCDVRTAEPEAFWAIVVDFATRCTRQRILKRGSVPEWTFWV